MDSVQGAGMHLIAHILLFFFLLHFDVCFMVNCLGIQKVIYSLI